MFTKTTKTLVAALVLASASLALATNGFASPTRQAPPSQAEQLWMDRASNPNNSGY